MIVLQVITTSCVPNDGTLKLFASATSLIADQRGSRKDNSSWTGSAKRILAKAKTHPKLQDTVIQLELELAAFSLVPEAANVPAICALHRELFAAQEPGTRKNGAQSKAPLPFQLEQTRRQHGHAQHLFKSLMAMAKESDDAVDKFRTTCFEEAVESLTEDPLMLGLNGW
jgi:hypothetical protein